MKLRNSARANWKLRFGFMRQTTKRWPVAAKLQMIGEAVALANLVAQVHAEIEPEIEAIRKADAYATGGYRTQLENLGAIAPGSREVDFGSGFKLHSPSGDCSPEMSETERALVYCASRNESPDKPI